MGTGRKLLLIEPDRQLAEKTGAALRALSYNVKIVPNGESAMEQLLPFSPDLILSELVLPGMDGYHLCRTLRSLSKVPLILCSSRSAPYDAALALDLGADDYVRKPYATEELCARIRAVLRRARPDCPMDDGKEIVSYPDLTINRSNYTVVCRGALIDMPPKELELLYFLSSSPNRVFTREQLLDRLWGYDYEGDVRTVDVHIKRLREKLGDHPAWRLATVWGIGYKFEGKQE